jgi:glycolate oxidase FAD binding subunit
MVTPQTIGDLRRYCEAQQGFLTVLEAPISFKQQLDVWGYSGNALNVMRGIKQQFDPKSILSPRRFVGEI